MSDKGQDKSGEELYRRIIGGDTDALSKLIELYRTSLTLYIYGMVKDEYDTEELMLDTFVRLIRTRKVFSCESAFRAYLFTIGKNLALNHLRKRKKHAALEEIAQTEVNDDLPEAAMLLDERKKRLYSYIRVLKTEHREVLHLICLEGMSYSDTARVMKKSERQIEGLLYRAKKSLKALFESEGLTYENF